MDSTYIKIGVTERSKTVRSEDPVVMRIGDVVVASFFLDDGRTVRVEMSPGVAETLALSLGRMAK